MQLSEVKAKSVSLSMTSFCFRASWQNVSVNAGLRSAGECRLIAA
jgi:hypothetical protein